MQGRDIAKYGKVVAEPSRRLYHLWLLSGKVNTYFHISDIMADLNITTLESCPPSPSQVSQQRMSPRQESRQNLNSLEKSVTPRVFMVVSPSLDSLANTGHSRLPREEPHRSRLHDHEPHPSPAPRTSLCLHGLSCPHSSLASRCVPSILLC